ncbi:MAG: hypothetical protein WDZ76_02435 [Pseudohongiellaceae bacterium]
MRVLFAALSLALFPLSTVAETIEINYTYNDEVSVDFSDLPRGPLRVAEFSDARRGVEPTEITADNLGNSEISGGYQADRPLADIIRDALVQGLAKGGASLVDADENLRLEGGLSDSNVQLVERDGQQSIQLTLRASVSLQGGGRTLWETVLFGRGTALVSEGIEPALNEALDRMVRGLIRDDYFLIEVL